MLDYLKTLVNFYPQTGLQDNVAALLNFVSEELEDSGFIVQPLQYNGVNNLYAHPTGKKHCRLLLQAHVDVVTSESHPYEKKGDRITGRGVYDMLFATAAYLQLVKDLQDHLPSLDIGIMLSGDEEIGSLNGVPLFLEEGYTTDVCIMPDAGDTYGDLSYAAKGMFAPTIRFHGQSHHGAYPWIGGDAITKLFKFVEELRKSFSNTRDSDSTLVISKLLAGDHLHRAPSRAELSIDIRYRTKTEMARISKQLTELLQIFDGEIVAKEDAVDYTLNTDNPYVRSFLKLYEASAGKKITFVESNGQSEARYFESLAMPTIMLRPDGGGAHSDDEWISAKSLQKFYELLKEYTLQTALIEENPL